MGPTRLDLYLSLEDERPDLDLRFRSLNNVAIVNITVIVTSVLYTESDPSFLLVHGDVRKV